jgi:hypothetical protein
MLFGELQRALEDFNAVVAVAKRRLLQIGQDMRRRQLALVPATPPGSESSTQDKCMR